MEKKKVLIVAYYWPPAGGPGVQRWLKFTKYLPDFNVTPIVYIPENPNYPIKDESLVDQIPAEVTVIGQPIKEPYKLARLIGTKASKTMSSGVISETSKQGLIERLMLFVRGNFFIPDARKNWVKPSVKFLSNYIETHSIDTVITTGPPHSLHLIGLKLKQKLNLKWIADFRDPWTTIGYHNKLKLTNFARQKHKALEQEVLNTADQIIVTSNITKKEFAHISSKPISVITNGYDDSSITKQPLDKKFNISHIGSLLSDRNPNVFWEVLSDLTRDNKIFQECLQLNLIGVVSKEILKTIEAYGLSQYVNLMGYVSHEEALLLQRQAQVLLMIEINSEDTQCIIPGKLFEYMHANRPIMAIGPETSDVENIIKSTNTGHYFSYKDYDALEQTLLDYFEAYRKGSLQVHPIGLQQYHRKSLTKKLADLILN